MKQYADLHVHLYGCPTAEEIWQWAMIHGIDENRLDWFASEYQLATNARPNWRAYFTDESGLEKLKNDYQMDTPGPFSHFQARINLPIAVCPLRPNDPGILKLVLQRHKSDVQLCGVEYRVLLPHFFSQADIYSYLNTMTSYCLENRSRNFKAKLALSIARPNEICIPAIDLLIQWLNDEPDLGTAISGVDFCGYEIGHPPSAKSAIFRKIRCESDLNILYHVGETLANLTPHSMLRWIDEAAQLGAHRLGHATILGLSPDRLEDLDIGESFEDAEATRKWQKLLGLGGASITEIQNAVQQRIAEQGAIIETCPTSNYLIADLGSLFNHPVKRFIRNGIAVIIGSDDPGIFATNISSEYRRMIDEGALTADQAEQIRLFSLGLF